MNPIYANAFITGFMSAVALYTIVKLSKSQLKKAIIKSNPYLIKK